MNKQIIEEASNWAVKIDNGPISKIDRVQLADWLKKSPVHVSELLTALSLFAGIAKMDSSMSIDLERLFVNEDFDVVRLFDLSQQEELIDLDPAPKTKPTPRKYNWLVISSIAATFVMVMIGSSLIGRSLVFDRPEQNILAASTGLGELRILDLEDGSIIHVNTSSSVSAKITSTSRIVELTKGEAYFDVKPDPTRPFLVIAGNTVIEAIGTAFNVRYIDGDAIVEVTEGIVSVREANTNLKQILSISEVHIVSPVLLKVGQKARFSGDLDEPLIAETNVEDVAAWRTKQLIFESATLVEIATEFNRYNHTKIIIEGTTLQQEKFSGVFTSDDPESFIGFLQLVGEVSVIENQSEIHIKYSKTQ